MLRWRACPAIHLIWDEFIMNTSHPAPPQRNGSTPVFDGDRAEFRERYNRKSFQFRHQLVGHPLFELPRLATLAETLLQKEGPTSVKWAGSNAAINMRWSEMPRQEHRQKITEAIADLERSGSWLLLYRAQTDPEYRALMDQVITEIGELAGVPLADEITWRDAYVFMASPFSVTPYHVDHESTFLFQMHGQREANIWDRDDRSVLTEPEIEDYYAGNLSAAKYKEQNQAKASVYSMVAGTGVHHPVLAPHAFKNGPTYSVALGVHFCLKDWDQRARIYQVNAVLRRLFLRPVPPGRSSWRDAAKIQTLGVLSKRKPKTKYELIRSGFMRLTFPLQMARSLKQRRVK